MTTLASAWADVGRQPAIEVPGPRQGGDDLRGVCHDLRGHLATIGMIASAIRACPELPAEADQRLVSLLDEVSFTTELVRRVVTGRREIRGVDLADLARRCAARVASTALQPVSTDAESVVVVGDGLQLTRLLDNLLENAVRSAGPDGSVVVRVRRHVDLHDASSTGRARSLAVVSVEDSGPGFGQAEPGMASLGHKITREVLAELGGTLELGRSDLGGGLVTVTLPAATG